MGVHVGEVATELVVDGGSGGPAAGSPPPRSPWRAAEDACRTAERRAAVRARTAAEGFDD